MLLTPLALSVLSFYFKLSTKHFIGDYSCRFLSLSSIALHFIVLILISHSFAIKKNSDFSAELSIFVNSFRAYDSYGTVFN